MERDRLIPGRGYVLMGEYLLGVILSNQELQGEKSCLDSGWFGESLN